MGRFPGGRTPLPVDAKVFTRYDARSRGDFQRGSEASGREETIGNCRQDRELADHQTTEPKAPHQVRDLPLLIPDGTQADGEGGDFRKDVFAVEVGVPHACGVRGRESRDSLFPD